VCDVHCSTRDVRSQRAGLTHHVIAVQERASTKGNRPRRPKGVKTWMILHFVDNRLTAGGEAFRYLGGYLNEK
jgi:hypothetical protein